MSGFIVRDLSEDLLSVVAWEEGGASSESARPALRSHVEIARTTLGEPGKVDEPARWALVDLSLIHI